jgi:N-acetylated-alpha-linked acidic dipeptidase
MEISTIQVRGERDVVGDVRLDHAWSLVEEFSSLVRGSGTDDEARAVEHITSRLEAWGVPHTVHRPELFISLPLRASLAVDGVTYEASTPSMARSTSPEGETAEIIYQPSGYAASVNDIFAGAAVTGEVAGKFVVTEGFPMPGKIADLEARGARGVVSIAPGERIHEGICTSIWGSPDLTSYRRQPEIPVVAISNPDGKDLTSRIQPGTRATMVAQHDTRWRPIPVTVAEIKGQVEPERFVLLHGHLDSWHVGVGDNATGNATLLEAARVLHANRDKLARSVRICWWSGHSHGRYAGSTWYADTNANDLLRNCVCHVNCDSPGCRDATAFEDLTAMAEVAEFVGQATRDFTGLGSETRHPIRAGDISFNNLGITTFFMLSSTIPAEQRAERGLYAVGGCGGNIEWHTIADTIEVADREILLRDMQLYVGAVFRAANLPAHPLDFRRTIEQAVESLRGYDVGELVELEPTYQRATRTIASLDELYGAARDVSSVEQARPINDALLRIGRAVVPVLYSREGRFRQDPALDIPLLPDFAAAAGARGSVNEGVVRTDLVRARNRLDDALLQVEEECRRTLGGRGQSQ